MSDKITKKEYNQACEKVRDLRKVLKRNSGLTGESDDIMQKKT